MSARKYESVIAALQAQVAELEERVAELKARVGKHNCLIDCCDFDADMNCRLRPVGEVWGYDLTGDEYDDADVVQS